MSHSDDSILPLPAKFLHVKLHYYIYYFKVISKEYNNCELWMTVEIINQILQKVLNNLNFLALLNTLLCMRCSCRLDFHENLANTFNNIVWLAYKLSNWKVMSKAFRQLFIFSSCWDFFFWLANMKHTSRLVLATKLGQQKSMEGIHYSLFL